MILGSSEIKPEVFSDKIVFHIHESRPYGMPDEFRNEEIRYDDIALLPVFPPTAGLDCDPEEEWHKAVLFWIPKAERWIAFDFESVTEKSYGPKDEIFRGPHLFEGGVAPAANETGETPLVTRIRDLPLERP